MIKDLNFNLLIRKLFVIPIIIISSSCNQSDVMVDLPKGYQVIYEGGNQNRLLRNGELIIDSGLVECRFKNGYMLVSVDTTHSLQPKKINKSDLKFFIQEMKKDSTIKQISFKDLQKLIKIKSLEDIDITRQ